jgi:hypothetical protein
MKNSHHEIVGKWRDKGLTRERGSYSLVYLARFMKQSGDSVAKWPLFRVLEGPKGPVVSLMKWNKVAVA